MKLFLALFLAGAMAQAANREPKGSVVCEIPDQTKTVLGESWGTIRARIQNDSSLTRLNLEVTKWGANESFTVETIASSASKKYKPRNPKYEDMNRFTIQSEDGECRYEWILPKNISTRVNRYDGYLQQICIKNGKKLNLETITMKCKTATEYRLDEHDRSPTAQLLTQLSEQAQIANGSADVVEFSKENWNETRALRRLTWELPNEKGEICKYETLPVNRVAESIKAIGKMAQDDEMQKAVQKLRDEDKIFKLLARVTVAGESEACSRFNFHVYLKDGYMLDLDYDTGD